MNLSNDLYYNISPWQGHWQYSLHVSSHNSQGGIDISSETTVEAEYGDLNETILLIKKISIINTKEIWE